MANRNPMDFNGELIPVDIELPASIVVRIEKRCWDCDSLSKRCSSFVIEQVGSTAMEIVRVRKRRKPDVELRGKRSAKRGTEHASARGKA